MIDEVTEFPKIKKYGIGDWDWAMVKVKELYEESFVAVDSKYGDGRDDEPANRSSVDYAIKLIDKLKLEGYPEAPNCMWIGPFGNAFIQWDFAEYDLDRKQWVLIDYISADIDHDGIAEVMVSTQEPRECKFFKYKI